MLVADKKWGKGKDKIDDEDITFQRMVAKVRPSTSPSLSASGSVPFLGFILFCGRKIKTLIGCGGISDHL